MKSTTNPFIKTFFLITRCEQTSEDIVHDVFIRLWIKRERLGEIKDIHAYLFLMSRNFAIDHLRRMKSEKFALKEYSCLHPKEFMDDRYTVKEITQTLHKEINALPPRKKMIYELKRECGWSKKEIADKLSISPHTVKATMQIVLKKLKQSVQNEHCSVVHR